MKEGFIPVDEWNEDEVVIYASGKIMVIPFDQFIENAPKGEFFVNKNSCANRLVEYLSKDERKKPIEEQAKPDKGICHYLNYFLKFYDKEHELIYAYFRLCYLINNKKMKMSEKKFIHIIHETLFTPTMINKITQMVEDNYIVDVETSEEKYEQAFTNEHTKALLRISIAMKIMIGPMFHYIFSNGLSKKELIVYRFYKPLFTSLSHNSDIYNKLWLTISKRVEKSRKPNYRIWELYEALGEEPQSRVDEILKKVIITDNMFKYTFNKNSIHLNSVVINRQLRNFFKDKFEFMPHEMNTVKDENGLSDVDKLEMNSYKVDESLIVLSRLSINQAIERFAKDVTDAEVAYYKHHLHVDKFQVDMINYFYSKYMGYNDLNFMNRTQLFKLMIALKKHLTELQFVYLPLLLTSNIEIKNERMKNNQKFIQKVTQSDIYQNMMKNKFSVIAEDESRQKTIIKIISTFLNSKFRLVDFENKDLLDKDLEVAEDIVSAEVIRFIGMI